MGGRKGFAVYVKKVNPSVQVIHCTLHRENLASFELNATLHSVMKKRASYYRMFQELCSSCGATHQQLLFHSEGGRLSRGKVLPRDRYEKLKRELETFYGRDISRLVKIFSMSNGLYFSLARVI